MRLRDHHQDYSPESDIHDRYFSVLILLFLLVGLAIISSRSYPLFHSLAELFSIVIAFGIFVIAWNSRRVLDNNYLLFIGVAYLFVGGIDLMHTFAYKGMGVFAVYDPNHPTQLWIAARSMESLSLLIAPYFIGRRLSHRTAFAAYAVVTFFLLWSILFSHVFPDCYREGEGLTRFKIIAEYVICCILLLSGVFIFSKRSVFDRKVLSLLLASIAATIVSELAFTFYVGVYDLSNMVGHLFKIISFYFIYVAIIKTGVRDPFDVIFRSLGQSQDELRAAKEGLEKRVEERTRDLSQSNDLLREEIAGRKLVEAALRESEESFRKIFDESPLGIATSGSDYRFLSANEAFCRILGYRAQELTALTFRDLTHPDHVAQDAEQIRRLLAGEIPVYHTDKRYVRKDGMVIWGRLKVSAMRGANGRFEHFLAMLEDITAVKEAEKTIADEKERLLVTLRSIGDGVITTDRRGSITLVNKVAEELTGWPLDEALGKPLAAIFHIINEQTREQCESPVEKVLQSKGIVGLANHTALIRRDGTEMIIADSGAPIRDRESRIIGVVLVFRDITEKEKGALALQNAQKLEAVGVLAAGIAHDFNNLLGGIFGYLDLAREQAEQGDGGGAAKTLYKGIGVFDRAKNLTQQLLTFSKGGLPLRKTLSLAEHVRKSVSFALSGSNISPVFTISPDVRLCDFDENQMAQVFDNIAINARQAMPLGGKIDVTVSNVAPDDAPAPLAKAAYVCVSIRDYGVGITKEHLPRIFDPFFTTKQQGNGLGLTTSYSIVKNHDGIIAAESILGKGTTFHIYLPASPGQAAVTEKAIMQVHKGEGRILVMDDEEFVLDVATRLLKSMGYEVTAARDGDEAIALVRQAEASGERFSAAILDLTIPGGKGGREIVPELLNIDPMLKAIASSGYSSDPVMSAPAEHGFSARLAKPYRKADLARVLESVLGVSP